MVDAVYIAFAESPASLRTLAASCSKRVMRRPFGNGHGKAMLLKAVKKLF